VPDYPPEALGAATDAVHDWARTLRWRRETCEQLARVVLDAAAADLGEHAAGKILAHMNAHGPRPGSRLGGKAADDTARRAWRRHLGIAARIAARAFLTEEDEKRMAAEALARGDYVVCDTPEAPG